MKLYTGTALVLFLVFLVVFFYANTSENKADSPEIKMESSTLEFEEKLKSVPMLSKAYAEAKKYGARQDMRLDIKENESETWFMWSRHPGPEDLYTLQDLMVIGVVMDNETQEPTSLLLP